MLTRPKTERAWYNLLAKNDKESMAWKARFDRQYGVLQEYIKDQGGLKECARLCAEYALQGGIPDGYFSGLNEMHPRAVILLAKYGVIFSSMSWDPIVAPTPGGCFGNAYIQIHIYNQRMRREKSPARMEYVEGIGFGARSSAVLHAWHRSTLAPTLAMDWTWHAVAGWCFYLGIPLTQRQHHMLRKLAYPVGGFHLLFREDVFPKIEEALTKMLERRKKESNDPAM